jgi:NADH-quinone oxidoreductase subunit N
MTINIGIGDVLLISPMIALLVTSIIPLTIKVLKGNVEQSPSATLFQGLCGIIVAIVALAMVSGSGATAFSNALLFDGITLWVGLIALVGVGAALLLMYDNPATTGEQFSELVFLTLSSAIGMLILVSAVDLLMVFIGLETMSLALYLMIAMSHEQKLSKEAALKYFILGSFASAIFLYGVAFIFGSVGSTYIIDVINKTPELVSSSQTFIFGMTLLILGFCFKVSIVPFHAWTPDVYQGAPTPHTAYMATAVKAVSFAAFLRLILTKSLVGSENLLDILQWLAVLTMLVGNVAAILQNNFKRMLAYSSVAHSGYIMIGIITTGLSDDRPAASSGVIFYLAAYSLMTLGSFAIVALMERNENSSIQIDDLAGYATKKPWMALCLTVFLLSLAGIPPTVGFFGKFYIFQGAIGEGLIWLAIWGVLNSVISVYYYLRPIVVMYMKEGEQMDSVLPMNATRTAIIVSAVLVVVLGLISGPLFSLFEKALS